MTPQGSPRVARRQDRTRAALIAAAQVLLVEQGPRVSVQAITDRADVATGSFYNYFTDKGEVFAAAYRAAGEAFVADLVACTDDLDDPAARLCTRIRLTARCPVTHPVVAALAITADMERIAPLVNPEGAMADVEAALRSRGLAHPDPTALLLLVSGAAMNLVSQGVIHAPVDDARVDAVAEAAMLAMGLGAAEAHDLAHRPLPTITPAGS